MFIKRLFTKGWIANLNIKGPNSGLTNSWLHVDSAWYIKISGSWPEGRAFPVGGQQISRGAWALMRSATWKVWFIN